MQVIVINLPDAVERRTFQEQQLQKLSLNYTILVATSVDDIDEKTYKQHYNDWLRSLKKTEVACYYSHKKCWDKVISSNQPALILEDDAYLSDNINVLLNNIKTNQDIDYIDLEVTNRKKNISHQASLSYSEHKLSKIYLNSYGAAGYVLFPSGAKKLIKHEQINGIALADAHIASCHNLNAFQAEPACVVQFNLCHLFNINVPEYIDALSSSISIEKKPQKTISFQYKRYISEIKLGLRKLNILHISDRRLINIDSNQFKSHSKQ